MIDTKGHPNRLGIAGWLGGGRWGFERYLYTLHRLTGLGLLALLRPAHLRHLVSGPRARVLGQRRWDA